MNQLEIGNSSPPKKKHHPKIKQRNLRLSTLRLFEDGVEVLESTPCRDQQRLLLAAEAPDLVKPVAAEAAAFAGAVDALGRHKLGLNETEAAVKSLGFWAESATRIGVERWKWMEMVAGV